MCFDLVFFKKGAVTGSQTNVKIDASGCGQQMEAAFQLRKATLQVLVQSAA